MIKKIQMAIATAMLVAMAVYGWTQATSADPNKGKNELDIALARHEARVVKSLGLNQKQTREYDELQAWLKNANSNLYNMSSGQVEKGLDINKELHKGLKRIFTSSQYSKYMNSWKPADLGLSSDPMATGTPFGGADEAIMNKLKLSPKQWSQYRAYQQENENKLEEFRAVSKTNPTEGATLGRELNKWTKSTMRRILSEDQYYEWIRMWFDVMNPSIHGNQTHNAPTSAPPIAGKAGG